MEEEALRCVRKTRPSLETTVFLIKRPLPAGTFKVTSPLTRGEAVKQIQTALAALHYYPDKSAKNFGIDGAYGAKTANAVKRQYSIIY